MTEPVSPTLALRARLGGLRRRIRALRTLLALARLLAATVVLLGLYFVADRLLDLPLGVRRFVRLGLVDRPEGLGTVPWILLLGTAALLAVTATRQRLGAAPLFAFLAAGIAGVLAWLAARAFGPLGAALPDEALALTVEQRFRRLGDRLASALDFEKELRHPTRGESEAMMRVVLDEAAAQAQGLEFARAISGRRALWWGGAALAAMLVAGAGVLAMRESVWLWARRGLLLEEASWPRSTTVVAVEPGPDGTLVPHDPARPFEVAVGRPITLTARTEGTVPDEVLLLDRLEQGRPLARRLFAVPDQPGLFQTEIRDVRRPFDFVLQGGDDVDEVPVYRVEIVVAPRVLAVTVRVTYPAYLRRAQATFEGGNVTVPQGSSVAIEVETDVPVASGRLALPDAMLESRPSADDGRHLAFDLEAKTSVRYRVLLTTATGRESDPSADAYEVVVEPDDPPTVRWVYPGGPLEVTPTGRVPLLAVAEDDYGVEGLALEVRLPEDQVLSIPLAPWSAQEGGDAIPRPATDGPFGRARVRAYVPLEVGPLEDAAGKAPVPPARLAARLLAVDSRGQTQEGTWTSIDVFLPADLERSLGGRRATIRAAFELALADARSRREQVEEIRRQGESEGRSAPRSESEQDLLRTVQFAQAKLAQDVAEATQDLLDLFNAYVYDRLGSEGPTERILALIDRHHRSTYGEAPADAQGEAGDPVFPYAVYDAILAARRERRIFDAGMLDRMLAVLEPSVAVAARTAPAAHALAVAAASGEASLQDLLAAQDAVIADLERTLTEMATWRRLSDLIVSLRRIIEEQQALDERLAEPGSAPGEPPRRP